MIAAAGLVHAKGVGHRFQAHVRMEMSAQSALGAGSKKPSTWLSQEALVGV
jgi:hypothetical protein